MCLTFSNFFIIQIFFIEENFISQKNPRKTKTI